MGDKSCKDHWLKGDTNPDGGERDSLEESISDIYILTSWFNI